VSSAISFSDDVRFVQQQHYRCHCNCYPSGWNELIPDL